MFATNHKSEIGHWNTVNKVKPEPVRFFAAHFPQNAKLLDSVKGRIDASELLSKVSGK